MAWKDVCTLKSEGGLGVRPLKEVNMTHGLKIIWRLLSEKTSLWGQWIRMNLTKKKSFWEISGKTQQGSWMWKKILKLRDIAKTFHRKDIGNGRDIPSGLINGQTWGRCRNCLVIGASLIWTFLESRMLQKHLLGSVQDGAIVLLSCKRLRNKL